MTLSFFVAGRPIPKGRPRVTRAGKTYTPATTVAWEATVTKSAQQAMCGQPPMTGTLYVCLEFYGARVNADIDNLGKAVLDAMNLVTYQDDKQVSELLIRRIPKGNNVPGVNVTIRESDGT